MPELYMSKIPQLPYAMEEAINRLRINVSFLGKKVRKIMIVSAMSNEGKSTVCTHLWRQLAESGTKTVLVDGDMRKSVMAETYGMEVIGETGAGDKKKDQKEKKDQKADYPGTTSYLSGDGPLDEVIYKTQYASGDIIPNFNNIVNPSLLLESERFKDMLDELAEKYRYVFVDAPPLNLVSDGERIGYLCDGAILVVRAGVTTKTLITNCAGQLERAGCPLLGVVLNRVEGGKGGYYTKRYGAYYYGADRHYYSAYYTDKK